MVVFMDYSEEIRILGDVVWNLDLKLDHIIYNGLHTVYVGAKPSGTSCVVLMTKIIDTDIGILWRRLVKYLSGMNYSYRGWKVSLPEFNSPSELKMKLALQGR